MTNPSPITQSLTQPQPQPPAAARLRRWMLETPLVQFVILLVLAGVLLALIPAFITRPTAWVAIIVLASLLALAAMGQTLVVILGGLDMSIAGHVTFGAMIAAQATSRLGWQTPVAMVVVVVVTGVIGALVGWVCHRFKIEPLVITLGVGVAMTGGTLALANGDYNGQPHADLKGLTQLTGTTFGIPVPPIVFIVAVLGIVMWVFLSKTTPGRKLYATGVNPRAAAFTRIPTGAVWAGVFAASAIFAGLAGMFIAGFGSGWTTTIGDQYLFSGLAAVLVGGTTFGSVRGGFTRTALGALILTVLSTIIVSQGLTEAQTRIVYGIIIIGVVAIYGRDRHVRDRF